jgi:acyl-CoA thioesterase FadM
MLSRWSIGLDRRVGPDDRDPDGYVKAEVFGAWLSDAVEAYLAQCEQLHQRAAGRALVRRPGRQPRSSLLGRPDEVLVTASATEVRPTEFFVSVRVRPFGNDVDLPVNATCRVSIEDRSSGEPIELGAQIRAEIVALEQAAEYMS